MIAATVIFGVELWSGKREITEYLPGVIPSLCCFIISKLNMGMGTADGMIVYVLGILLGGQETVFLLMEAFCIAGLFSLILIIVKKVKKDKEIAFVPFILAAFFYRNFCIM